MKQLYYTLGVMSGFLVAGIFSVVSDTFHYRNPKYKIGQTVSNGYCSGMIGSMHSGMYQILDATCGEVTFNFVWMNEKEIVGEMK